MDQFIAFIDETIEKLGAEEKQLAESHRKDEANLVRIRMNIYDICKTVYGVCARMPAKTEWVKRRCKVSESGRVRQEPVLCRSLEEMQL